MSADVFLSLLAQVGIIVAAGAVMWIFKNVFSDKLEEIKKHMQAQVQYNADQRAHNSAHDEQTRHIISRVEEMRDQVEAMERTQQHRHVRNQERFARIMQHLGIAWRED